MTFVSNESGLNVVDEPVYKSELGSYKIYVAQIDQAGTDNPIVTVLKNTIGNIVWTRTDQGSYSGTLSGAFIANKTFVLFNQAYNGQAVFTPCRKKNANIVVINTFDIAGVAQDDLLVDASIEIRVYN